MRMIEPVLPAHDGPSGPVTHVPDWSVASSLPLPASARYKVPPGPNDSCLGLFNP